MNQKVTGSSFRFQPQAHSNTTKASAGRPVRARLAELHQRPHHRQQ